MSRVDVLFQEKLLREAKKLLKDVKPVGYVGLGKKKEGIVLTEEHMLEWLQVFLDDRIMLDGCNHATVKR